MRRPLGEALVAYRKPIWGVERVVLELFPKCHHPSWNGLKFFRGIRWIRVSTGRKQSDERKMASTRSGNHTRNGRDSRMGRFEDLQVARVFLRIANWGETCPPAKAREPWSGSRFLTLRNRNFGDGPEQAPLGGALAAVGKTGGFGSLPFAQLFHQDFVGFRT